MSFFFFLDEQLKITNSNTTAWQESKSNLLDKKRIESNSIHSVSICQHSSVHLESKNQNFFCICYFCFWSWIRGRTPRTGRNMARRWLRYNLKIFQFCLSLYSFNYFLQTDFIREKKKKKLSRGWQWDYMQPNWCQHKYIWPITFTQLAFYFCSLSSVYRKHLQGFKSKEHLMLA